MCFTQLRSQPGPLTRKRMHRGLAAALITLAAVAAQPLEPINLRVNYVSTPIGVDTAVPRFSWVLRHGSRGQRQSAYRIVVSHGGATLWDSGVVASSVSQNVPYAGPALVSDADYAFNVTTWDADGAASPQGASRFSTALLTASDWHGAAWVRGPDADTHNMLRAEFTVAAAAVTRARLYIVGLGYYLADVNGVRADSHVLGHFTTFDKTVIYDAVDVTRVVRPGCNALGVQLGHGWYAQTGVKAGPRSLLALLSVTGADGTVSYWASAQGNATAAGSLAFNATAGPVTADDIFAGESYDARREQAGWAACGFVPPAGAAPWVPAVPAPPPGGALLAQTQAVIADEVFLPTSVAALPSPPGAFVLDFGQHLAGIATLTVPAGALPAGATIVLRFGELLHADGSVWNQFGGMVRRGVRGGAPNRTRPPTHPPTPTVGAPCPRFFARETRRRSHVPTPTRQPNPTQPNPLPRSATTRLQATRPATPSTPPTSRISASGTCSSRASRACPRRTPSSCASCTRTCRAPEPS